MAGRKTKFTDDTRNGILDALRGGATFKGACASVGISQECFRQWRNKGEQIANGEIKRRKNNEEFEQFYYDLQDAEQASFTKARKVILDAAAAGDWRAADAYLSNRDPEWGKDKNVNVNLKSKVIKVTLTGDD
jgi:hypothetical protein